MRADELEEKGRAGSVRRVAPNLCLVGFGEVARTWVRSLTAADYPQQAIRVLYLNHGRERVAAAAARAAALGLDLARSAEHVATWTEMFVHATDAAALDSVFAACLPALRPGHLWVDVVSTAASAKERIAAQAAAVGAEFVDAAIMGAAWKSAHRAPLWICGSGLERFTRWAQAWGTPVVPLGRESGAAQRVKSCRSIVVKGFAASLIEGLLLAEMNGITDSVLKCIRDDFGEDLVDIVCERFIAGSMRHGERRAAEMMNGPVEIADRSGWDGITIASTAKLLHRVATSGGRDLAGECSDYRELLTRFVERVGSAT